MKKLKCCGCKNRFPADTMININGSNFHAFDCATTYANEKGKKLTAKKDKQDHTAAKRKLKDEDRSFQLKKTQQIFNRYIRIRDADKPCISCQRYHSGQYHAGHYRTVGANPELRFDDRNCHKQCSACNNHLSGNIVNYRINLVSIFGAERVELLEGPHEPKRYTIEELKQIQAKYSKLIKDMTDA